MKLQTQKLKLRGGGSKKQNEPKKIISSSEEINNALNCLRPIKAFQTKNCHPKCVVSKNCSMCLFRSCLSKINTTKGRKNIVPVEIESEHYQRIFPKNLPIVVKQILQKALEDNDEFSELFKPVWFCNIFHKKNTGMWWHLPWFRKFINQWKQKCEISLWKKIGQPA